MDQTVATAIHAATVKAARKADTPQNGAVNAEKVESPKKPAKAAKKTDQDLD